MSEMTFHIGANEYIADALPAGLYLVATPIGNLGDVTIRALQTLAACDVIYCEDTRITVRLLERYAIRKPLKQYHEHNAKLARPEIIEAVREGKSVALVSDAGTPLISDPGFKLVEAFAQESLAITALPGASAVLPALQLSALATDQFCFIGFLPEKKSQRLAKLQLLTTPVTTVAYESPYRILDALEDIATVMPDRQIAATRELTKLHEEVLRGTAKDIHTTLAGRSSIKGEFAIVIAGAPDDVGVADDAMIEDAITEAIAIMPASKAASHVAKLLHLSKQDIYSRILMRKNKYASPP